MQATTILFLSSNVALSQNIPVTDYPVYRDGTLTIPRVDTDAQAGNFQDAEFQFDTTTNTWTLLNYRETTIIPGQAPFQDKVESIITDSVPVQVFLKISGLLPNPCSQLGQINQRLNANKFEITMHLLDPPLLNTSCIQVVVPYEKIIPLQVYGLSAGTYEYSVNGEHTGTFSLAIDNIFPAK